MDCAEELPRDRVLRLEDVAGFDDHAVIPLCDNRSQLVVVARDDGQPFHLTSPVRCRSSFCPRRDKGNPGEEVSVRTDARVAAG